MDSVHYQYEKLFFYAAPRSRSTKQRKYAQVDLTKEFEIRNKRREAHKQTEIEKLYERHDKRVKEIRG